MKEEFVQQKAGYRFMRGGNEENKASIDCGQSQNKIDKHRIYQLDSAMES